MLSKDELLASLSTAGIFNVMGLNNHNLCQNSLLSSLTQRHNEFIAISCCCFPLSLLQSRELLDPGPGVWKILDINTLGSGTGTTPLIESVSPRKRPFKQCSMHYTIRASILGALPLFSSLLAVCYDRLCAPHFILHPPRPLFIFCPPHSIICPIPDFTLHTVLHTPYPIYHLLP